MRHAPEDQRQAPCATRLAETRERVKWIVAAFVYVLMILFLASLPGSLLTPSHGTFQRYLEILQNALHVPLYAGLAWLLVHATCDQDSRVSRWAAGTIVLTALAIAITDEWIQSHVPARTASLFDIGLDLIGVLAVAIPRIARRTAPRA